MKVQQDIFDGPTTQEFFERRYIITRKRKDVEKLEDSAKQKSLRIELSRKRSVCEF